MKTENLAPHDTQAAINALASKTIETEYKGVPVFVHSKDVQITDLQYLVDRQSKEPYRLEQKINLLSADSFIEYFNQFAMDNSAIFVDAEAGVVSAILDYHKAPSNPSFGAHRAYYRFPETKEWVSWIAKDNTKMDQEGFALFIEDNMNEITSPSGAEMLEIVSCLKAKKDVDFKSGIKLDSGEVQFTYSETINGQTGNGQLNIPEKIELQIQPFTSGPAYNISARFRYRITATGLVMWYSLIRAHVGRQDAINDAVKQIIENITDGQVFDAVEPI